MTYKGLVQDDRTISIILSSWDCLESNLDGVRFEFRGYPIQGLPLPYVRIPDTLQCDRVALKLLGQRKKIN